MISLRNFLVLLLGGGVFFNATGSSEAQRLPFPEVPPALGERCTISLICTNGDQYTVDGVVREALRWLSRYPYGEGYYTRSTMCMLADTKQSDDRAHPTESEARVDIERLQSTYCGEQQATSDKPADLNKPCTGTAYCADGSAVDIAGTVDFDGVNEFCSLSSRDIEDTCRLKMTPRGRRIFSTPY